MAASRPCGTLDLMATSPPLAIPIAALASERAVRECLQWFTREKQWINEVHLQLARVPAPTFLEAERGEWMASKLRSLGWHTQIDRAGNVIATPDERARGPYVALT